MTPFRYDRHPDGSRFRRAGPTPGICCVSEQPSTAVIETAFHLSLFHAESPDTPFPSQPSKHSVFDVPVETNAAINLAEKPFNAVGDLWMHPSNYEPCRQLEKAAREVGIELIRYASARDPEHGPMPSSSSARHLPPIPQRETGHGAFGSAGRARMR